MKTEEFNLSDEIYKVDYCDVVNDSEWINIEDVKEFIKRRIDRTKLIIKLYPHKHGEELAGQLNEDLIKDAGEKLK